MIGTMTWKDFSKVFAFVLGFYLPPGFVLYSIVVDRASQQNTSQAKAQLKDVAELVNSLSFAEAYGEACEQMKAEVRAGRISFFALEAGKFSCSVPEGVGVQKYPVKESGKFSEVKLEGRSYLFIPIKGDSSSFVVGALSPEVRSLFHVLLNDWEALSTLIVELLLVVWCVFGFFVLFVSRNLGKIKKVLAGNSDRLPWYIRFVERYFQWLTVQEFESIHTAADEASRALSVLLKESIFDEQHLKYSIMQDLKKRIKNGEHPTLPVTFQGTVARLDLNGYSKILTSVSSAVVDKISSTFDHMAAELAYRYGGLFESNAGDEVVYCFRGENAYLAAVAFSRDLMANFSSILFDDGSGQSFSMSVKGAVYDSELEMKFGAAQIKFQGNAFLYTNRMLSGVADKSRNILVIHPRDAERVSGLAAEIGPTLDVTVKGMNIQMKVVSGFRPMADVPVHLKELFRSDADLIYLLEHLHGHAAPEEIVSQLYKVSQVTSVGAECRRAWAQAVMDISGDDDYLDKHPTVLPSLVSMGTGLIDPAHWDQEYQSAIQMAVNTKTQRTAENAADTLISLNQFDAVKAIPFTSSSSHRLRGNILTAAAVSQPSPKTMNALIAMAKSPDKDERKSGLYAAATAVVLLRKSGKRAAFGISEYTSLLKLLKTTLNDDRDLGGRVAGRIREAVE